MNISLGPGGLPSLATLFPNLLANGTVQSASTSYASVLGSINYLGVNAAAESGGARTRDISNKDGAQTGPPSQIASQGGVSPDHDLAQVVTA
ncbi:MAG TPA: hypothetical protein VFD66_12170, partial [Verrucomicrobiae bacterium]|nr:hypothetical protein [Verrucomicrobiae bacterium]